MTKKNRTRNAFLTVTTSLLAEAISLVCGLILPKLILNNFGSAYNGVTQSITQFISYISLMKAGIGGATAVALYEPLSNKDNVRISEILAATQKFMRKIALIFVAFIVCLAIIYPIFIVREFDWWFTSSLIFIISISTFATYYFGFTYQTLLNADQKAYVVTLLSIFTTILNTIISVILIKNNFSIHVVKLGSSITSIITPVFLFFYVRKKYSILSDVKPNLDVIPQRWDATAHEVASFVNNNVDIVLLSFFTSMSEISVYTVYHYVISNLKKIVNNCTVGFGAAFGDMYAKGEIKLMHKNLSIFELITFSLTSILFSVALATILPFVAIYTNGVNDTNYIRPTLALIAILAGTFNCFRIPYRVIVINVGHYKQTKNGAIMEAIINIVISIIGIIKFGVVGALFGTLCAMMFRTLQFAIYLSRNIMNRNIKYFIKHSIICFVIMCVVYCVSKLYLNIIDSWFKWMAFAAITTLIATVITLLTDLIFYKEDMENLIVKLRTNIFKGKI